MTDRPAVRGMAADALSRSCVRRAAIIAGIVGTVLAVINHGDTIVAGQATAGTWAKVLLTYLVPYSVSTVSTVLAVRGAAKQP